MRAPNMIGELLTIVALAMVGFAAFLYFAQDRMIFYPMPAPAVVPRPNAGTVEEVALRSAEGHRLTAWLVLPSAAAESTRAKRQPLLIYFGGNAEEVSWMIGSAERFAGHALLLVNYRGYGSSEGAPGERALFADALAWYDWARGRPDLDAARIAVMGRSLGSGVAVHLAANRAVTGVVLVSPYDSVRAVAQSVYPFVPVGLLLRHPFDSLSRAATMRAPLLCIVAQGDRVIPPAHSRRLFDAWGAHERIWRELPGNHDSVSDAPGYWGEIAAFLRRVSEGAGEAD